MDPLSVMLGVVKEQPPQEVSRVLTLTETARLLSGDTKPDSAETLYAVVDAWAELHRRGILTSGWISPLGAVSVDYRTRKDSDPNSPISQRVKQEWEAKIDAEFDHFSHLTELGKAVVRSFDSDPDNTHGYIALLQSILAPGSTSLAYAVEAATTYGFGCYRAALILLGGACESLVLPLRTAVQTKVKSGSLPADAAVAKALGYKKPGQFLPAVDKILSPYFARQKIPDRLDERYSAHWNGIVHAIRMARNKIGHPSSPADPDRSHTRATLILFPKGARLTLDLESWLATLP